MCVLLSVLLVGPRAGMVLYWILWPARWEEAFETVLVPLIGFLLLPWSTLSYVLVAPGGVDGFDYGVLFFAGLIDIGSLVGGVGRFDRGAVKTA